MTTIKTHDEGRATRGRRLRVARRPAESSRVAGKVRGEARLISPWATSGDSEIIDPER